MNCESPVNPHQRTLAIVLIAGAILLGGLVVKRAVNGNSDLGGNYRHWRINLTKATLPVRREGPQPEDPDAYPPLTYALFAPLGALPLWATATLWYGINLACSVYLWRSARNWLLTDRAVIPECSVKVLGRNIRLGPERILGLAIVAILPSWIGSLLLGQNTLMLMALTWGAFQAARWKQPWLTGSVLALATTIKVLPVVFLLPFVIRRNYRVLIAFAVSGLILLWGLGSLYFGPKTNYEFHLKWLQFATQGPENRPPDPHDPNTLRGSLRYHNQSIETVLARLMMDVPIHNKAGAPRVNLINVSAETWRRTRSVASGVCLLLGLLVLCQSFPRGWGATGCASAELERIDDGNTGGRASGTPCLDRDKPLALSRSIQPASGTSDAMADATRSEDAGQTSAQTYAILSLLQLFVSPIVWSHYYLWLFWPLLVVLDDASRGRRSGFVIYVVWMAALPFLAVPQVRAIGLHLWVTLAIYVWICWPLLYRVPTAMRCFVGRPS